MNDNGVYFRRMLVKREVDGAQQRKGNQVVSRIGPRDSITGIILHVLTLGHSTALPGRPSRVKCIYFI